MLRLSLFTVLAASIALAQDVPKVDPAKAVDPAKGDPAKVDPAKGDPAKGDPAKGDPAKGETSPSESSKPGVDVPAPSNPTVVTKSAFGDGMGVVMKVTSSQITLKVPMQVQDGTTTQNVRVPNPVKPGHPQTYHTVRQQVPKYKTVQKEMTFDLGSTVKVKTESGKVTDLSVVRPGITVALHLTKVKEGKAFEKAETHVEVTRITVPNQAVSNSSNPSTLTGPGSSTDSSSKKN